MSTIKKCPFGCFAVGDASLDCDHVRLPSKASAPPTPLDLLPRGTPVLDIEPSALEKFGENQREWVDYLSRAKRTHEQQQRMWSVARAHNATTRNALGRTIDLGIEFPDDCRYWVE